MNLPEDFREGKYIILPIKYECDVTFGTGTLNGAEHIIKASKHLEYYDEEFDKEFYKEGIDTHKIIDLSGYKPEKMVNKLSELSSKLEKIPISLGGDHAITIGLVKGLEKKYEKFGVIQIDAHSDYRDSWNGNKFNHACMARQINNHEILQIGVRSQDYDEKLALELDSNIKTIYAHKFNLENVKKQIESLPSKIYLTIDVDGFDPTLIKSTGTPEPGGLSWKDMMNILKLLKEKTLIGVDICEFGSENTCEKEAYIIARLITKIISSQM